MRYTRKDAVRAVERLSNALGKPYGAYVKDPAGNLLGNGGYALDYNATYGGCVIHEFLTTSTVVDTPFGDTRLPIKYFIAAVRMTIMGIGARKKDRGIRLHFVTIEDQECLSALLFSVDSGAYRLGYPESDPDMFESLAKMYKGLADQLGLYFDRSALDEWLKEQEQEDPR